MPSAMGALPISTQSGDCMSLYLQGLKTARALVVDQGLEALDEFIKSIESNLVETTSVQVQAEYR